MSYGKSIGSLLVKIIKAEKEKECDMCKYKKTMKCPNSSLCYSTKDKPYFKSKIDKEDSLMNKEIEEALRVGDDRKVEEYIKQLEQKETIILDKIKEEAYWKGYVQKQNEAIEICKICKYRKKHKELIKKSETLDKVKEFVTKIATENAEKYNSENQKEVDFSEWNLALEILNIIEGEREYCCTCGVELNSKNKALNNMCNECKYGLDYQKEREEK